MYEAGEPRGYKGHMQVHPQARGGEVHVSVCALRGQGLVGMLVQVPAEAKECSLSHECR